MQLNPYLTFSEQCKAAFKFYEQCLGGKIAAMMTYEDSTMAEGEPKGFSVSLSINDPVEAERIFHALTKWNRADADPGNFLGCPFWAAGRSIWHLVDD